LVGVQQPPVVINAAKRHAAGGRSQSCFSAALSEAMKPVRVRGISPRFFFAARCSHTRWLLTLADLDDWLRCASSPDLSAGIAVYAPKEGNVRSKEGT
jgi:hypothetical protein